MFTKCGQCGKELPRRDDGTPIYWCQYRIQNGIPYGYGVCPDCKSRLSVHVLRPGQQMQLIGSDLWSVKDGLSDSEEVMADQTEGEVCPQA